MTSQLWVTNNSDSVVDSSLDPTSSRFTLFSKVHSDLVVRARLIQKAFSLLRPPNFVVNRK